MESLNLKTLVSSLPTANMQNAEKDLLNNFKAAALSITTLYRSSRHTSKRAYNAGYAAACQDLLVMIQQGVSVGDVGPSGSHDMGEAGMTIGKVMDWIEARVDAIKSREEEEDEDEEKEKEKEKEKDAGGNAGSAVPKTQDTSKTTVSNTPIRTTSKHKEQATSVTTSNLQRSSQPPSPSPPPPTVLRPIHHPPRPSKSRPNPAASNTPPNYTLPLNPISTPPTPTPTPTQPFAVNATFPQTPMADITFTAGAKRRHAVMMMLDSSSSPVSVSSPDGASLVPHTHLHAHAHIGSNGAGGGGPGGGGSRRRTKSSKMGGYQNQNVGDAMDVEEDSGRERKRLARR